MTNQPLMLSPPAPSTSRCESSNNIGRLSSCGQCTLQPSIYTCPACSLRTCSLSCSNQHKLRTSCTGKRNRVNHIPLNQYSWGSLMRDYTYLEEVNRTLLGARGDASSASAVSHPSSSKDPKKMSKRDTLVKKASEEGVQMLLMPDGMSRRKINTTNYSHKKSCMHWMVEFVFRFSEDEGQEERSEDEKTKTDRIGHIVHQIASSTPLLTCLSQALSSKKLRLEPATRSSLLEFIACPTDDLKLEPMIVMALQIDPSTRALELSDSSMPVEISPSSLTRSFHLLELQHTLGEALSQSTIVEWPVIEVWPVAGWLKRIACGELQIVPKLTPCVPERDSGWGSKRQRLEAARNVAMDDKEEGHLSKDSSGRHGLDRSLGPLVDYSSADDDE